MNNLQQIRHYGGCWRNYAKNNRVDKSDGYIFMRRMDNTGLRLILKS